MCSSRHREAYFFCELWRSSVSFLFPLHPLNLTAHFFLLKTTLYLNWYNLKISVILDLCIACVSKKIKTQN